MPSSGDPERQCSQVTLGQLAPYVAHWAQREDTGTDSWDWSYARWLGESFRKWSYRSGLDTVGSWANSIVRFLKSLWARRWETQREATAVIDREAAVPRLGQKMGMCGHGYSVDGVLGSDMIKEALAWVLIRWCSMNSSESQQETTTVCLWAPGQLPAAGSRLALFLRG